MMVVEPGSRTMTWPQGGGELGAMIRAHDWSQTPLGPAEDWPQSLRTVVDLMVGSGHAMMLAWGPRRTLFYNDAYAPMLGTRHPDALGLPFQEAWPDIWDEVSPLVDRVFAGETVRYEDFYLEMTRKGYPEDTWWNFSYSPVRDEAGAVAGLLNVTVDATPKVRADRAERALRESEARYRAFVTSSTDAVYRMSHDWSEMRQLDGRDFIADTTEPSQDWMEHYIQLDDRERVRKAIERAIRAKSMFELEHRVIRADGTPGWTFSRAVPILGESGEIIEWLGSAKDITAAREAEQRLRESEERQAFLLKLSDALRPLADPAAVMAAASETLGRHLGVGRCGYGEVDDSGDFLVVERDWTDGVMASLKGTLRLDDFGADFIDAYRAGRTVVLDDALADARARGVEGAFEAIGNLRASLAVPLLKDGRWVSVFYVQQTEPREWTAEDESIVREVAERTWAAVERARAEAVVRESEERLQLISDSLTEYAIFTADGAGTVTSWNSGAERLLGYSEADAVGMDGRVIFTSEDRDKGEADREIATALHEGRASNERWHVRKDGSRFWGSGAVLRLLDDDGDDTANGTSEPKLVKILRDETERKAAERHQQTLLAELQHRVRNTLAVIRSIARRTSERSSDVDEMISHFEGRLNAFSRVQSTVTRNPDAGIDLGNLIEDELLAVAAREGDHLRVEGPQIHLRPRAAESISLAIHELATNAVKYGALAEKDGRIRVSWERVGSGGSERLELAWTESGLENLEPPSREGFGHDLLRRTLPYDLRAETKIEFRDEGLRFSMTMPLGPAVVADGG